MAQPGPCFAQAEEKGENALLYKGVGAQGPSRKVASLESCLLNGWLRVVAPLGSPSLLLGRTAAPRPPASPSTFYLPFQPQDLLTCWLLVLPVLMGL